MISRLWHGWTTPANADAYEDLLRRDVNSLEINNGVKNEATRGVQHEVEFVTLTMFDSLEAVREFAGEDYEAAVVPPEARKLLAHFDERSAHYQTVLRVE